MGKAEKAEKKEKKDKKRAAEAEAEEAPVKKDKKDKKKEQAPEAVVAPPGDEKPKLSKEEKAAKKAAKEAKKAGAPAADFAPPAAFSAPAKAAAAEAAPTPSAEGGEANRLFVGNLSFKMTEDWLKEEFASAGTIGAIDWLMHADTGKFKGAVFCTMGSAAEAAAAVAQLNGKDVDGRPMKVEIATARKPAGGGGAGAGTPMPENDPSESVFLGNLSWSVDEDSMRALFADCGAITKVKWLEDKESGKFLGKAFVDFESIAAATKAVALHGSDLCGRPVRVNFSKPRENKGGGAGGDKWGGAGGKGGGAGKTQRPSKPTGDKPDGCVELFCGNLPWSVDETKITDFFAKAGASVVGTRWLNDKETGEFKGIGFVTFASTEEVDKAVSLGGEPLEGRSIRLDYAGQKKKEGAWQGGW